MRLGVLDIGSNTVHLVVVDAYSRARPDPFADERSIVRLMQYLEDDGSINPEGVQALERATRKAVAFSRKNNVDELIGIVTSAVREATNGPQVMERLEKIAGTKFGVLSGAEESELTYFAARRWHGWAAGRIMVLDIGGGSFEVSLGIDEEPEFVASVPLGAGRLTKDFLKHDPPRASELVLLRREIESQLEPLAQQLKELPSPDHVVATSKTFRSLARLAGNRISVVGPEERRRMSRSDLGDWVERIARLPAASRMELPGITPERTYQIVAGAEVAYKAMKMFKIKRLEICPWALREGVLLERIDRFDSAPRTSGLDLSDLG
ncbi:Ppx/GppA phosphatase family protein [Trueperella bialowiezensis]|uniref:Exopolyphosphatase n=1 Tax=Trueperella bialowiezensis TaxID=312285 RepID=A0A3S4UZA0_9ACTO|nr:Ppx/GppA family phosphatase [Trueperella bialowiezensis]VEI13461.1 Exopolyphosphatase [Trueperella bialowiezensis]